MAPVVIPLRVCCHWRPGDSASRSSSGRDELIRHRHVLIAALVAVASLLAAPAAAGGELFPDTYLFRPYVASDHRPGFGILLLAADPGIADTGTGRFSLRLGGRFGIVRWGGEEDGGRALQLGIEAGFRGQFDLESSLDNVGWDGNYGFSLTSRRSERLAWKLAVFHLSAHVGDEYAERTGRRRAGYTREELQAAVAWRAALRWRLYGEAAWGYVLRADDAAGRELQEPGRLEAGVEYDGPLRLLSGRAGWFAAVDATAYQESDWRPDVTVHAGLSFPKRERRWRLGVLLYDGRVPLGEFFRDEESYVGLGLWLDV